jgi:hypothetical protein
MRYKPVRCYIKSFQEIQYSVLECDIKWNWNIILCTNGRSSLVGGSAWPINITVSLLKQITRTPLLISYERFYIQSHCFHKELIAEQNAGENNPMYQVIFDPCFTSPPAVYTSQYCTILPTS